MSGSLRCCHRHRRRHPCRCRAGRFWRSRPRRRRLRRPLSSSRRSAALVVAGLVVAGLVVAVVARPWLSRFWLSRFGLSRFAVLAVAVLVAAALVVAVALVAVLAAVLVAGVGAVLVRLVPVALVRPVPVGVLAGLCRSLRRGRSSEAPSWGDSSVFGSFLGSCLRARRTLLGSAFAGTAARLAARLGGLDGVDELGLLHLARARDAHSAGHLLQVGDEHGVESATALLGGRAARRGGVLAGGGGFDGFRHVRSFPRISGVGASLATGRGRRVCR